MPLKTRGSVAESDAIPERRQRNYKKQDTNITLRLMGKMC